MKINKKYRRELERYSNMSLYNFDKKDKRKEFYEISRERFLLHKKRSKENTHSKILNSIVITIAIAAAGTFGYFIYDGPVKFIQQKIENYNITKENPEIQKLDSTYHAQRDSLISNYQNKSNALENKF